MMLLLRLWHGVVGCKPRWCGLSGRATLGWDGRPTREYVAECRCGSQRKYTLPHDSALQPERYRDGWPVNAAGERMPL